MTDDRRKDPGPSPDAGRERPGVADRGGRGFPPRAGVAVVTTLLAVEVFALAGFQAPNQTFLRFAAMDSGGELAIQNLVARGFRPAIDFGYPYGLLSLLVGRVWYGLVGLSPGAFRVEVMACMILTAWGLARFAVSRRVGLVGFTLIAAGVPDLLSVTHATSTQCLEQALLVNALAEQARGRRGAALALLTACCFIKPSLAFVQGLAVVVAVASVARKTGCEGLPRVLLPALLTTAVLATVLAAAFGFTPLARTVFPARGMAIYRANHYGFFSGTGRDFWLLPNAGLRGYFRYEAGFWLLGTALLAWGGASGAWRRAVGDSTSNPDEATDDEIVATSAAVHLGFIVLLFGHRWTWVYSLPVLLLGLSALARRGPRQRFAVWVLALLLLVNDRSKALETLGRWKTDSPSPITLGLWSTLREREEWARALDLTRGGRPVLLATCEGGALLIPGFAPPTAGYVTPGNMLPAEVKRKAAQLAAATWIVTALPPDWPGFAYWPELADAVRGCDLVMQGDTLRVYRRDGDPARPGPARH